jgi:hypothetical protein
MPVTTEPRTLETDSTDAWTTNASIALGSGPSGSPRLVTSNNSLVVSRTTATALQLLRKGNKHVPARSQNRLLQIISGRTLVTRAPELWRILYRDDKASYNAVEVRFKNGEIDRVFEPSRFLELFRFSEPKLLDLKKVNTDSDEAIRIALAECDNQGVQAKSVELKLERGYGGLPVWSVELFGIVPGKNSDDAALGSVILLAEDGKVLKRDIVANTEKVTSRK